MHLINRQQADISTCRNSKSVIQGNFYFKASCIWIRNFQAHEAHKTAVRAVMKLE